MEKFQAALKNTFGIDEISSFKPYASYYEDMDFIEYMHEDIPCVSDRIDDLLTIFSDKNENVIGFRVKGFRYFFNSELKDKYQLTNQDFIDLVDVVSSILTLRGRDIIQDSKKSVAYRKVYALAKVEAPMVYDFDWKNPRKAA